MADRDNKPQKWNHEMADWQAFGTQQLWFDRFKATADAEGLHFSDFQQFLRATIYKYFATFSSREHSKTATQSRDAPVKQDHKIRQQTADVVDECVLSDDELEHIQFSRQQEMQLFKAFDVNNDHLIDRGEFATLCSRWLQSVFYPVCGLVIVDMQNDFIDGSLALINGPAGQDGAEVVPIINDLIDKWQQKAAATESQNSQAVIVYTQDWHPSDHIGFHANLYLRKYALKKPSSTNASESNACSNVRGVRPQSDEPLQQVQSDINNLNGVPISSSNSEINKFKYKKFLHDAKVFDTVLFEDGRVEQKLWPTHCVQNSWGAQLHPQLKQVPDAIHIQKGTLSHVDAYSAFWDNMHLNETGLRQELISRKVTDLFFCGLALDFCVSASALDAAKAGFTTFVIQDACRGLDEREIESRKRELLDNGIFILNSGSVTDYLSRQHTHGECVNKFDRSLIKVIAFRKALL